MLPKKFCHIENGQHIPHDYGDLFFEEPCGPTLRMVIGPTKNHINLMAELATVWQRPQWYVLYVLVVARGDDQECARYQSPAFDSFHDLTAFLHEFQPFFEEDGRHHIWIGSTSGEGLLIYDQHNVIFAYGPLAQYRALLESRGFRYEDFWFPAPHSHHYHAKFDQELERLFQKFPWQQYPLQSHDLWD